MSATIIINPGSNQTAEALQQKAAPNLSLRRMVSFRLSIALLETLKDLLKKSRKDFYAITKTDIIEASILHASLMSKDEFEKMMKIYQMKKGSV